PVVLPPRRPPPSSPLFPYTTLFRSGAVPPRLDEADHVGPVFQTKGRAEYLLNLPGTGRILVRQGSKVTIDADSAADPVDVSAFLDRKSTRLNSSHVSISYAVFCLKK